MVHDPVEQGQDKFVLSSMFNVQCSLSEQTEVVQKLYYYCSFMAVQLDLRTVTHRNTSCSTIK